MEAEKMVGEMVETMTRVQSPAHPNPLTCMAGLASIYMDQQKWGRAEALLRQVVKIRT